MFRDAALALSMANVCFLPAWTRLLSGGFYMPSYGPTEYGAAILNVLLLGLSFFMTRWLGLRWRRAQFFRPWMPILMLIVLLNYLRTFLPYSTLTALLPFLGGAGLACLGLAVLTSLIFALSFWRRRLAVVVETVFLISFPLAPLLLAEAAWLAHSSSSSVLAHREQARAATGSSPGRVLWLVFDELDQVLTFEQRPGTVKMPELDRLRSEAVYANSAYPPGDDTLTSITSLISGRRVVRSVPASAGQLMVTFEGASGPVDWSGQPNVFRKARELGAGTGIVGWYMPYCRLLGNDLTTCSWQPWSGPPVGGNASLRGALLDQFRSLPPWSGREHHLRKFQAVLDDAKKAAGNPQLGLVFVHWPTPHYPGIYDRRRGEFTVFGFWRPSDWYLDNLALVDRTLGELRCAMEKAGTWEDTSILVTSDHSWRDSAAFDGKRDRRVPFILKVAGERRGIEYRKRLNTVLIHDLVLAMLRGELTQAAAVVEWLDQRRVPQGKS